MESGGLVKVADYWNHNEIGTPGAVGNLLMMTSIFPLR
jgi:hypothetical protein